MAPKTEVTKAYLPPYQKVRESALGGQMGSIAQFDEGKLRDLIKLVLRGTAFDEDWYVTQYPDVRDAVARGIFRSGKHHFIESGYFEGRRPCQVVVDEEWYSKAYPDVGEGVEYGEISSCQHHFDQYGEKEGRSPFED
uniref:hypothetical protein n=1 Tax=Bradyrhizobium sp. (strain ORS 278) TaxID=114615 RepID=UPI0012FE890F|nr:hypothetical protein [Bradyrhizobium sp. ORS 278]